MFNPGFCLVLAIWGDAYPDESVNALVHRAQKWSPLLREVVLLTDRHRPFVDGSVKQTPFPEFFNRPEFFGWGYRVKLAVFARSVLPPSMPCVYLDLDTMVTGDLSRIAALVKDPSDIFMLPPGSLISFSALRRIAFRWTQGKRFATGNSSVMAYHSGAQDSISDVFERRFGAGDQGRYMAIDDVFISWAGQSVLKGIPVDTAVSFRREFLARSPFVLWLHRVSPLRRQRRARISAITFNGLRYKPEALLQLTEGERILDGKGRFGIWSDAQMGSLRQQIIDYCRQLVTRSP